MNIIRLNKHLKILEFLADDFSRDGEERDAIRFSLTRIDQLEAENAELRQQLEKWREIFGADDPLDGAQMNCREVDQRAMRELNRENAELRRQVEEDLRLQLEQSEAANAAMRSAIGSVVVDCMWCGGGGLIEHGIDGELGVCWRCKALRESIESTAGQQLLDRLREAEANVAAIRQYVQICLDLAREAQSGYLDEIKLRLDQALRLGVGQELLDCLADWQHDCDQAERRAELAERRVEQLRQALDSLDSYLESYLGNSNAIHKEGYKSDGWAALRAARRLLAETEPTAKELA